MDRLGAMRVYVAVVEQRGFSAAARTLGLPVPMVCRKIAELEDQLGAQLLRQVLHGRIRSNIRYHHHQRIQLGEQPVLLFKAQGGGIFRGDINQRGIAVGPIKYSRQIAFGWRTYAYPGQAKARRRHFITYEYRRNHGPISTR